MIVHYGHRFVFVLFFSIHGSCVRAFGINYH